MKTVLITGTTSGIGKAFAEKFADEGYDLILVARNEQKLKQQQAALQENYHVAVKYIVQDLTQESAAGLIMADIDKWKVTIDVLVNNAGFNECGFFVDTSLDRELEMINMHIRFVTELTKRILVHMKEKRLWENPECRLNRLFYSISNRCRLFCHKSIYYVFFKCFMWRAW